MGAPGFEPRATLALPTATIGTMAPEASANAMYANRIAQFEDEAERARYVADRVAEQEAELNLLRMGSDLVVDTVVEPSALRTELLARLADSDGWERTTGRRHHPVGPV
jgi:acetyl-CoA carboxylase carboxyltransferase component